MSDSWEVKRADLAEYVAALVESGKAVIVVDSQVTRNISYHALMMPGDSKWLWDRSLFELLRLVKDAGYYDVWFVWGRSPRTVECVGLVFGSAGE